MKKEQTVQRRRLEGTVVSDKMAKTIVVKVNRSKSHPKYKKQYIASKRYKVHDEKGEFHVGDHVIFEECRPISRDKCWRAISKAEAR